MENFSKSQALLTDSPIVSYLLLKTCMIVYEVIIILCIQENLVKIWWLSGYVHYHLLMAGISTTKTKSSTLIVFIR